MVEIPNSSFVMLHETSNKVALQRTIPVHYSIAGILALMVMIGVISSDQLEVGEPRFILLCVLLVMIPLLVMVARLFRAEVASYDPVKRLLIVNNESRVRLTSTTSVLIESRKGRSDDVQYTDCLIVEGNQVGTPFLRIRESYSEASFIPIREFFERAGLTSRVKNIEESQGRNA